MPVTIDLADVPAVAPETLMLPMRALIEAGRGLCLLRGLESADTAKATDALWSNATLVAAERPAALLRFNALVAAFRARRLQNLLMRRGFRLIDAAVQVTAGMRLNANRGFNAATLAWAIEAELERMGRLVSSAPVAGEVKPLHHRLAA